MVAPDLRMAGSCLQPPTFSCSGPPTHASAPPRWERGYGRGFQFLDHHRHANPPLMSEAAPLPELLQLRFQQRALLGGLAPPAGPGRACWAVLPCFARSSASFFSDALALVVAGHQLSGILLWHHPPWMSDPLLRDFACW